MAASDVSQDNVAFAVLLALTDAEAAFMPRGSSSLLFVAKQLADAALRFHRDPTFIARADLAAHLEHTRTMESNAMTARNVHPDSLISRGIALSIYVAQSALSGVEFPAAHALREARWLLQAAQAIGAQA